MVLLVVVYADSGAVATGLLGAIRMVPATLSGALAGSTLARFRGGRFLVAVGLIRAGSAALCGVVIATGAPVGLLYVLAAVSAGTGAVVRPTQATLMPALARSPAELVAANMAWTSAEGLGAAVGPFLAGALIAAGLPALAAVAAALAFLGTAGVVAGLRFEQPEEAGGRTPAGPRSTASGERGGASGFRLAEGLRTLRRRPVPGWTMLGVYGQVLTRGLLSSLAVVAAIELLGLGDPGVGLLNAALGLGGLVGAVFAVARTRVDQLVRTESIALVLWGAPIALIGILPWPAVGFAAMVVIGIANAVYDVAIITIFQRGCANEERAAVFGVFEGAVGVGAISGSLLAPVFLAVFGDRGAMVVGGAILPVLATIIYLRIRRAEGVAVVDERLVQLLREVPVFAELPLTAIERLAAGLVPVAFPAGGLLMRQGDPGDRFIVVAAGEIEVRVDGRTVGRLGPGSGVGEIALLRRSPRTATVLAATDVTGYTVGAGTFLAAVSGPASAATSERVADAHLAHSAPA